MSDYASSLGCAVRATHRIDLLPAIPTQDWVAACAHALSALANHSVVVSLVANCSYEGDRIEVISSGVAFSNQVSPGVTNDPRAISLIDRSERITRLGFLLPERALERGIVGAMYALDQRWNTTPIGRALTSSQLTNPIMSCIPIKNHQSGLCLMNFIAFEHETSEDDARLALLALHGIHEPLSTRAHSALERVNNPRAWLTDREHAVLDLLIEGHSVRVIAEKLGRSAHTVHDHVKNLHKKIEASSRGELIAKALGHKELMEPFTVPAPILASFPGDQVTELKPAQVMARPLRA